jgi:hypothetical protein
MNSSSAPLVLAAHLAVLSSISFGGFPTVLPDVHNLAVAKRWVTDQEFANFFAVSQVTPGPDMTLMMSFIGLKVGGIPWAIAAALAMYGRPTQCITFRTGYGTASVIRHGSALCGVALLLCDWACHCRRLCYGSFRRSRVAECSDHCCCNHTDARDAAQIRFES